MTAKHIDLYPKRLIIALLLLLTMTTALCSNAAQKSSATLPMGVHVEFDSADSPEEVSKSIQIVLLLTVLSLAPSIMIMCTSFTRIIIVFGLLKRALGTQQTPPAQILAGMSLFLTIFIMMPVWQKINTEAFQPYMNKELTQQQAFDVGIVPLRKFMALQTGRTELELFTELSKIPKPQSIEEVPTSVLIPAFMISELKTAFQMGFLLYLPFLVIDLVIASSLMSMGMMMLPPMMISLPIKLLFFVLADGWNLVIRGIVTSFTVF